MHLRNRFFFLAFEPGEVLPVTLISTRCSYCFADLPTRAGCPVLDSVLFLFLKHTNIWFSYKVPFKILLAPNDDSATYFGLNSGFRASDFDPNTIDHCFSNAKIASKFARNIVGECQYHRHCHKYPVAKLSQCSVL